MGDFEKADLPIGWVTCRLPDFTEIVMGQSPPSETYNKNKIGLPFFQGKAEFGPINPNVVKYCDTPNKIAQKGATLLSVRAPVGPTNLATEKCCIGRGLAAIHPLGSILPNFVFYLFRCFEPTISKEGTGSTFSAINKQFIEELQIPLPPLPEQKRIVAKIEELFSELDKGIESFKTAREQLKVYRQALLKHAFEGKLTAVWREANKDKLETADALLKRIQAERAERYKQQVKEWEKATKEWENSGKKGSKPGKPSTPKVLSPLTAVELAELPELPHGWGVVRIGDISECLDSIRVPINKAERSRRHGEIPYYGANGQVGWIDGYLFDEPLILVVEDETFTGREKPFSYKIVGKSWVNNHAHILKPLPKIEIDFLNYQLFYYPLTKRTTGTTGRKKLTQDALVTAPVNICSICEQKEIVVQLEAKLSALDNLDQTITTALQRSEALRQSILKKAFSGQLVPQDPNDEPAAVLLARIKAERATVGETGRSPLRTQRKPTPCTHRKPRKPRTKATP